MIVCVFGLILTRNLVFASIFRTEYLFNFDQPFEIHDDIEVLKRLGLAYGLDRGEVSDVDRSKIKSYLPLCLRDYVDQIVDGKLFGFEE